MSQLDGYCRKRVWDNGDMDYCGVETDAESGLCRKHAKEKRAELLKRAKTLRVELAEVEDLVERVSRELGILDA